MEPIKAVIIDDDKASAAVLADSLAKYNDVEITALVHNEKEGLAAIQKTKPELVFLDIELGSTSGLDFSELLRDTVDRSMRIVFYTSYDKYLLPALRHAAFDFLLKPLNDDELRIVMERFSLCRHNEANITPEPRHENSPGNTKSILITTVTNEKMIVRTENIGYFKYDSDRKMWRVILNNLQHFLLKHNTNKDVILSLAPEFVQIHKAYIININYLNLIGDSACTLLYPFHNVTELKISKNFKKDLLNRFYDM